MKYWVFWAVLGMIAPWAAYAEAPQQEIHIYPDGQVRLVGAELYSRHTSNLYTVKSWDMKWVVPIDPIDPYIKLESAYGVKIAPAEILEKHLLEIAGKFSFDKSSNAYQILPTLIRDLSIKTGELPAAPPAPAPAPAPQPPPTMSSPTISPPTFQNKLTMALKPGFWGGQVKILQDFLKKQGYFPKDEPTSRYFGPMTQEALAEFQKANALEAIGTLGPKTRALINSLLSQ